MTREQFIQDARETVEVANILAILFRKRNMDPVFVSDFVRCGPRHGRLNRLEKKLDTSERFRGNGADRRFREIFA